MNIEEFKHGLKHCHTLAELNHFFTENWNNVMGTYPQLAEALTAFEAKQEQLAEDRTEIGALVTA